MKKFTTAIIASALVASALSAANTQELTRATNKLILSQSKIILKLKDIENNSKTQTTLNSTTTAKILSNEKEIKELKKKVDLNSNNIEFNTEKIKALLKNDAPNTTTKSDTNSTEANKLNKEFEKLSQELNSYKENDKNQDNEIYQLKNKLELMKLKCNAQVKNILKRISYLESRLNSLSGVSTNEMATECKFNCGEKIKLEDEKIINDFLK